MVTQLVEFAGITGETYTATLIDNGTDIVTATASGVVERTNATGVFLATFVDVPAGTYRLNAPDAGGGQVSLFVEMLLVAGTYIAYEIPQSVFSAAGGETRLLTYENLHPRSINGSTAWVKTAVAFANGYPDPWGGTTALRYTNVDNSSDPEAHRAYYSGYPQNGGDVYTIAYVKGTLPTIAFQFSTGELLNYDLDNSVTVYAGNGASLISDESYENGWRKIVIYHPTVSNAVHQIWCGSHNSSSIFTPDDYSQYMDVVIQLTRNVDYMFAPTNGAVFNALELPIPLRGSDSTAANQTAILTNQATLAATQLTILDDIRYGLAILAGNISNAGTAAEQYDLTHAGIDYRALFAGLDAAGNRAGVTLSKP